MTSDASILRTTEVRKVPMVAWGLIVAVGLMLLLVGVIFFMPLDILFGNGPPSAYSAIAQKELSASSRLVAVFLMLIGVFQIILAVIPFRRGERWAWYAYAAFPLLGILGLYAIFLGGGEMIFAALVFVVLPSLALLLSANSILLANRGSTGKGIDH